jgi:hypothetical protein
MPRERTLKKIILILKNFYQLKYLKKIIDDCYCKYVSKNKNEKLYEEISILLGLYAYTKDKINIKPFIINKK